MAKKASKKRKKKNRRVPLLVKWLFFLVFLLAVVFVFFYLYTKQQTGPEKLVENYLKTFMSKDATALFNRLELPQNVFLTPEKLEQFLEENHKYSTITTYSRVEYPSDDPEHVRRYSIQYWDDGRRNPYTQTLTIKNTGKLYYLFDNWKIDTSDFLAKNCTLEVPAGANAAIDGIELSGEMAVTTDSLSSYQLGDLFPGTHTLRVRLKDFNEYTAKISLNPEDYSKKTIYSVTPSMLQISDENKETLAAQTRKLLQSLYSHALSKKSFSKLAKKYPFEESEQNSLEQAYNTFITNNIDSPTHITDVAFRSFRSEIENAYAEDHCYAVNVNTTVKYTTSSAVAQNIGKGSSSQRKTTEGESTFTTTFHYNNGTWYVSDTTALDTSVYYIKY